MKRQSIIAFLIPIASLNAAENDRPNILWLVSEDNSAEWIEGYGNEFADTPNLRKLASEGFIYDNLFSNSSASAPSRSSLITGVHSISMGTQPQRSRYNIPHDQIRYYPDYLREAGYYTVNSEKTDYNIGGRPDAECWDVCGECDWEALKSKQPFFQVINYAESHESRIYDDLVDVSKHQHSDKEVKLYSYHPDTEIVRNSYATYHDAIKRMDSEVGKALKKLDESGLADNTIVIYISDHGGVLPRDKRFVFRSSLHTPLIIRIPERFKSLYPEKEIGSRVDRLVSFVDLPKTFLSLSKSKIPESMVGKVFLGEGAEQEREYHFAYRGRMEDGIENSRVLSDKRYLYVRNYLPHVPWMQYHYHVWREVATLDWVRLNEEGKLNDTQSQFFKPKGAEALYDMQSDPDCAINLIGERRYAEVAKKMRLEMRCTQIEYFDAGLLPESEMIRLANANKCTIYEVARNPMIYDVETILECADIALAQKRENLPTLRKMLKNENLGVRYWGMMGCFLLDDKEVGEEMLSDKSDEIRCLAAWLLMKTGCKSELGVACFNEMLLDSSYAIHSVYKSLEWMGEDLRTPLLPALEKSEPKRSSTAKFAMMTKANMLGMALPKDTMGNITWKPK